MKSPTTEAGHTPTHFWREVTLDRIPRTMRYRPAGVKEHPCIILRQWVELNGANREISWCWIRTASGREIRVASTELVEAVAS